MSLADDIILTHEDLRHWKPSTGLEESLQEVRTRLIPSPKKLTTSQESELKTLLNE
jgi:hypothetical protein